MSATPNPARTRAREAGRRARLAVFLAVLWAVALGAVAPPGAGCEGTAHECACCGADTCACAADSSCGCRPETNATASVPAVLLLPLAIARPELPPPAAARALPSASPHAPAFETPAPGVPPPRPGR